MIKAGFMLEITSWENDADNYKTIQISGLTKEKCQLYINIIKLFKCNHYSNDNNFGNLYAEYDSPVVGKASDAVVALLVNFDEIDGVNEREHALEEIADYMTQFLGCGKNYVFRAYDSHKVYFVPTDIEEVTQDFK